MSKIHKYNPKPVEHGKIEDNYLYFSERDNSCMHLFIDPDAFLLILFFHLLFYR